MLFICIFHSRHEHWLVLAGETQMEQTMARFSEFLVAENQTSAESQIQPILMSDKKKLVLVAPSPCCFCGGRQVSLTYRLFLTFNS